VEKDVKAATLRELQEATQRGTGISMRAWLEKKRKVLKAGEKIMNCLVSSEFGLVRLCKFVGCGLGAF
jgi:hypothetical protein